MGKIDKSEENIYEIPPNVSVCNGYVYLNTSTSWVQSKSGDRKHCDHNKLCIGKTVVAPGGDWKSDRRMYANSTFLEMLKEKKEQKEDSKLQQGGDGPNTQEDGEGLLEPKFNRKLTSVSVGAFVLVERLCYECGIIDILKKAFNGVMKKVLFVLDIALFMLLNKEADYQYYEFFARSNATFSNVVMSESEISKTLREYSLSEIKYFKTLWARKTLVNESRYDEDIIVFYDSTNVNSQATGVFLVEKGHAKDDPSLPQVNTDYVVSEKDGMPITFSKFPGSITDVSEATKMITFFDELFSYETNEKLDDIDEEILNKIREHLVLCCDRGYISKQNVNEFDNAKLNFLLLLKGNMTVNDRLVSQYCDKVKSLENYDPETGLRAMTVRDYLFDSDRTEAIEAGDPSMKLRWFHIIWSQNLYYSHFNNLMNIIKSQESQLDKKVKRKIPITLNEFKNYSKYFNLSTTFYGKAKTGNGNGTCEEQLYLITSFSRNYENINDAEKKCGFFVLVSSKEMTAFEAIAAYSKRDCVEKVFLALKSFLGMSKEGVGSGDAMHTQALIWFVAAIMRCQLMIISRSLKCSTRDRRNYTVPSMICILKEITADKDLITGKYTARYTLSKKQKTILDPSGITKATIDDYVKTL